MSDAPARTVPEPPPTHPADPSARPDAAELRTLFAELAGGRRDALDELYGLLGRELFGLALWRCRRREDAADVVQDVFLRLAGTGADLRAVRDPRAYLLAMTRRAAVDRMTGAALQTEELHASLVEARAEDPERAFDARRVSHLLGELPAEQREVLYLHHFLGLSFGEIGRVVGVSRFTAASRHRLGLRRLRRLLGEPT